MYVLNLPVLYLLDKLESDLQNVFWEIANSDPFRALSFDRLHAHQSGLFGKHLWSELQDRIKEGGRQVIKEVDDL